MKKFLIFERTPRSDLTKTIQLADLRQMIVRWLMGIVLILGITLASINTGQYLGSGDFALPFVIWGAVVYLAVVFVLGFYDRGSYLLRSISSVVFTYLIAVYSFVNFNPGGDHLLWLTFFVLLSTVMLGLRASMIANLVSIATYITAGYLFSNNILSIGIYYFDQGSWITAGLILTVVNLSLSAISTILLRGLDRSLSDLRGSYQDAMLMTEELSLEQNRLQKHAASLEYRLNQTRSAAEIIIKMGAILDPEDLMHQVANLVQNRFDLYYVGIFTVDDRRRYAHLAAGSGEAGKNMLAESHQLAVGGSSMVGWATAHGESRISLDVDQESVRFRNPHLPLTRSELALPIQISNQTIGAMSVQSTRAEAFDDEDISTLQSIADSLGTALDTARLFQQFDQSLREIQQLNRRYLAESWGNIWAEEDTAPRNEFDTAGDQIPDDLPEVNVPLVLRGDQVIGNISFATEQSELSSDDQEFLEAITNQAALALESARLLDEANKRVEQERALRQLTSRFSQTLDFETLLQTIVKEIGQVPLVREASIHVTPPDQKSTGENGGTSSPSPTYPPSSNDLPFNQ